MRRSVRSSRGKAPERFGDWDEETPDSRLDISEEGDGADAGMEPKLDAADKLQEAVPTRGARSARSIRTESSKASKASTIRRQMLRAELEADEAMAQIERRLIKRRLELRRAEILEEEGLATDDSQGSDDGGSMQEHELPSSIHKVDGWLKEVENPLISTPITTMGQSSVVPKTADGQINVPQQTDKGQQQTQTNAILPVVNAQTVNRQTCAMQQPAAITTSGNSAALEEITRAFAEAMKAVSNSSSGNDVKKFMARNSSRELPQFSGEPEEWPNFIAQFRQTTQLCGFNNVENMARLQKCLKGNAKASVQAFMVTPDNVERVVKTLERRFGRPECIVEGLIAKIQGMSALKEGHFEALIEFADVVQNLTSTLETLKCQNHMFNPQLLKEVVGRLPSHLRMDWGRCIAAKPGEVNLKTLAEWLQEVADAASLVSVPKPHLSFQGEEKVAKKQSDRAQIQTGRGRKRETVLATTDSVADPEKICLFCEKKNHNLETCRKFIAEDINARWVWTKENKLCFVCFKPAHRVSRCRAKKPCGQDGCNRFHHQLLHSVKKSDSAESEPELQEPSQDAKTEVVGHTWQQKPKDRVLLRIVPVKLRGSLREVETYALCDDASTVTLIDESLAASLGVKGPHEVLNMQWTNTMSKQEAGSRRVSLDITGATGETFKLKNVRTVSNLVLPTQTVERKKLAQKWKYLEKVPMPDMAKAKPMILIGQDNCNLIIPREIVEGPKNGPVLSRTRLGWILHGNVASFKGQVNEITLHISHHENDDDKVHQLVKDYFKTESFGVQVSQSPIRSKEDVRALAILEQTTKRVGERWETGLLWRREEIHLPESKRNALKRLYSIEKKMDRDLHFAEQYCTRIEEYFVKGYARRLSREEALKGSRKTWYLPHFAVVNAHKPGKIRLVFDAAAQGDGSSLNDALLKGPDLLNSLPSVLCKLRQKKIGFSADIKEMFPQIRIRAEDLPAQRFLWRGMERDIEPEVVEMSVMTFGATCSPSSAQYVKNRNAMEHSEEFPEAARAIVERHYMDDYLDSTHSEEEAIHLIRDVIGVHRRGGFQICNWTCSSREVLRSIPEELRSAANKDLDLEADIPIERVLGLRWDPNLDCFTFSVSFGKIEPQIISGAKLPTKREVLKVVMSVFDPLGFLAHFTIKAKVLLQDIWRSDIGWDDELTDRLYCKWKNWLEELQEIAKVAIPRSYSPRMKETKSMQLHIFCDASEEAFAAVAYLRMELCEDVQTAFVMAKTRVAPLKPLSIPRLELQAAVMGSRLARVVKEEHDLEIGQTFLWTDSKTVLCWLRSDARKFKTFVGLRIGEIEELTDGASWRWVPTKENVADDATRSSRHTEFDAGSRWWSGPSFLRRPQSKWPEETKKEETEGLEADEPELRKEFVATITPAVSKLPDVDRFSSWLKLVRATAWLLRFVRMCRAKIRTRKGNRDPELTVKEVQEAEVVWWRQTQWDSFPEEMSRLTSGKPVPSGSKILQLSPMLDAEGCLRIRGRIDAAPGGNCGLKQPIILHPKHPYTRLLVMHYHVKANHSGQEMVVNELRQRFWIPNMRNAVRSAWNSCLVCRIRRAKPQVPVMGSLPEVRLTPGERPFMNTGMDYFGPMEVTIGRRHEKRYGVLFTCLATRAVHLEIASSLTTDSAIMSIRRMIGRRGQPQRIYSDNGTNLRGADKELRDALAALNQAQIKTHMSAKQIEWHFIPPSAPHMGGSWERLVQSVKKSLRCTLRERAPREEVLQTLFVEAENSINSRPLTHVSADADDPESLTPNHLLIGSSNGIPPPGMFTDGDLNLRKQWRMAQTLADYFWKRWVKEYLPTLTRRTKWFKEMKSVEVNDLVFIADGDLPRNSWPRGVIIKTFPGKDGRVRVVDVKTQSGILRRPVAKICVLDVMTKKE